MVAFQIGKESKHHYRHMWKFAFGFTVAGLKQTGHNEYRIKQKTCGQRAESFIVTHVTHIYRVEQGEVMAHNHQIQVQG